MKRGFIIGVALTAAVIAGFVLSNGRRPAPASSSAAGLAPDFVLEDLDGKTVRLSDLKGQAVVVNFWATWCPPCREEIPTFIEMQKKYAPQGVRIVGIAMDDSGRDTVVNYVRSHGINYTVAMPSAGVAQSYGGIEYLPTTFYIGRDGKIVNSASGLMSAAAIEENIRAAMAKS